MPTPWHLHFSGKGQKTEDLLVGQEGGRRAVHLSYRRAYIVSQVHPEVQVIAGAYIIGIEVAKTPVGAAVQKKSEALHTLTRWDWQPA